MGIFSITEFAEGELFIFLVCLSVHELGKSHPPPPKVDEYAKRLVRPQLLPENTATLLLQEAKIFQRLWLKRGVGHALGQQAIFM